MLNSFDQELVSNARDVVVNSVMAEITKEDPHGEETFKDAVRLQVVATFQRLRLHLLVLDNLMEIYNTAK